MRKLVILFVGLLFVIALAAIGCIDDSVDPSPIAALSGTPTVAVSGCETCHTDKALLKELAVEPPEEEGEEGGGG